MHAYGWPWRDHQQEICEQDLIVRHVTDEEVN